MVESGAPHLDKEILHGHGDRIGAARAGVEVTGRRDDVLRDGRPHAGDRGHLHQARHPRHRYAARAGRLAQRARMGARDAPPRRGHGLLGAGGDQPRDRCRQCLHRRGAARGHRRLEPARLSRHGSLPGDRSGRGDAPGDQVGRAYLRRPPDPRHGCHGLPPGDDGPAGSRLSRPAGRHPRREGGRREDRVPAGVEDPAAAARRQGGHSRGDRAPVARRAPRHPRRQRRLVVGRGRSLPGAGRGDGHSVLHDADLAGDRAGGPRAGLHERA